MSQAPHDEAYTLGLLVVPMRSQGATVGTIGLFDWYRPDSLTDSDVEWVQAVADRTGVALEHAQLSAAAILNANCIVVYHPFWHSPLKEWLTSDASGMLSDVDLIARLEGWKRERSESKRA